MTLEIERLEERCNYAEAKCQQLEEQLETLKEQIEAVIKENLSVAVSVGSSVRVALRWGKSYDPEFSSDHDYIPTLAPDSY